jgi:5-oxoprolinase (ATP-hydrolysing) subunit A
MNSSRQAVDLNADLGEGSAEEPALMTLVTSANVACGGHTGTPESMRASVRLAAAAGVAVGAHPSYEDRAEFGRKDQVLSLPAVRDLLRRQVIGLREIAAALGVPVVHVKPHGALYNRAARDRPLAEAIAAAVHELDPRLILFGLAGSELVRAGVAQGLTVAHEVFADRTYRADGSLTPRVDPGALIEDEAIAVAQALGMIRNGEVRATNGARVSVRADTVCLHGDRPRAAAFARRLRADLTAAGIALAPVQLLNRKSATSPS